jgi:hypothetical protein
MAATTAPTWSAFPTAAARIPPADGAANPYLLLAAMLAAGHRPQGRSDGIDMYAEGHKAPMPLPGKRPRHRRRHVMQTNIEIARAAKMRPILEIAQKLDIPPGDVHQYGPWKAKVSLDHVRRASANARRAS